MKQFINSIGVIAVALFAFVACDNSEYNFDNLFPEEYHRVASIQDQAIGNILFYESGDATEMTFSVLRTGSDPSLSSAVGIETMSQEELTRHNAKYRLVDPSLYTVANKVSFSPEERYKEIDVHFTAESIVAMKKVIEELEANEEYYIALKITDIGEGSVYGEKSSILRKVAVTKPYVILTGSVGSKEESPTWIDASTNPEISFSLKLSIDNKWDFSNKMVHNPTLVEAYNAKYGTSFEPLPSVDNVSIENGDVQFTPGDNTASVNPKVKINSIGLNGSGLYLVPIEAQGETFESDVYYVVVENRIVLRENMLYAPFTVTYDGVWWKGLLDDDWNSYWHSPWKDPKYYDAEYGHWFQVKFDKPLEYGFRFKYWTRNYAPVLPIEIKISVSRDNGATWTEIDHRNSGLCGVSSNWLSPSYENEGSPITHMRFSVMKTNNGRCGIDSGACTALSGFRMWGK